jgi:hypothetical protein
MSIIVMQAPGPNIAFASLPSGATYISDPNGLIVLTGAGQVTDQVALVAVGCVTRGQPTL